MTLFRSIYTILFVLFLASFVFSQNKIDSLLDVGLNKDQYENPERAIEHALQILKDTKATDKQKVRSYHLMNGAYSVMGESKKAIEYSFKSKALADKIGSKEYSVLALGSIGANYRKLNLYDEALSYYTQALEILNDKNTNEEEVKFLPPAFEYEIGNIEYLKKNYSAALAHYTNAIAKAEKISVKNDKEKSGVQNMLSSFYLLKGHSYLGLEKLDSAEIAYHKVQEIILSQKDKFMRIYLLKSYGDLSYAKGNFKEAIDSAKKAEELIFFNDENLKSELYELLAKSYAEIKDYPESEKYYQLVQQTKGRINEEMNKATSTAFSTTKNELTEKLDIQKKWKIYLGVTLLFFVIITAIIIYIIKRNSIRDKKLYAETIARLKYNQEVIDSEIIEIENTESATTSISEEKEKEILAKLEKFEKSEKFRNKNISIALLASQLNTNTTYLSEVINKHKEKNFNSYLNELRINYIIEKIHTDSNYANYKIAFFAEDCGLPYSTFVSVFKNKTGITPSKFLKLHELSKMSESQFN